MPPMPDQTHVNGTTNRAIQERVVAPVRNPSARCSNQAPFGGAVRSGAALAEPPTSSENAKVLPQRRQRAISVDTLMSSIAIDDRHSGHAASMSTEGCHMVSSGSNTAIVSIVVKFAHRSIPASNPRISSLVMTEAILSCMYLRVIS